MYNRGHSYLGILTEGLLAFGSLKREFKDNYPDSKQTYSQENFSVQYMYYILNNVAFGVDLGLHFATYKYPGYLNMEHKQSLRNFSVAPMLELNMPVKNPALRNFSMRAGFGYGTQRSEIKEGNITTKLDKYTLTGFHFGGNYNFIFTPKLALRLGLEYNIDNIKYMPSDEKEDYSGPRALLGIIKFF